MHITSNTPGTLFYQVTYKCKEVINVLPFWLNAVLSFAAGVATILWFMSLYTVTRTQVRTVHVYLMLICFAVLFHQIVLMVYKLTCPWSNETERKSFEELLAYSGFITDLLLLMLLIFLSSGIYVCAGRAKLDLYWSCAVILVATPTLLSIQNGDYNWFNSVSIFYIYEIMLDRSTDTVRVRTGLWIGKFAEN